MLLEAFNKDRASLINFLQNATQTTTPVPPAAPDARTQEMINEKLKKAEELGIYLLLLFYFQQYFSPLDCYKCKSLLTWLFYPCLLTYIMRCLVISQFYFYVEQVRMEWLMKLKNCWMRQKL